MKCKSDSRLSPLIGRRCGVLAAGLAVYISATGAQASEPAVVDPARADAHRRKVADQISTALAHLKSRPDRARRFGSALLARAEQALTKGQLEAFSREPGNTVTVGSDRRVVVLQNDYHRLTDYGAALMALSDPGNLFATYALLYKVAPPHVRARHSPPAQVGTAGTTELGKLVGLIQDDLRAASKVTHHPSWSFAPPNPATCDAEAGAEDGTDRDVGSCSAYATSGIMGKVAFPLRDDLTCVKNQGRRGTCVAFGTVAAMETGVHVMNGNKVNLSEQHTYWFSELAADDGAGRYEDGLPVVDVLNQLKLRSYQAPKEKIWNYNPSWSRYRQRIGNVYLNSCVGYRETCSDFAFQGGEVVSPILGGAIYSYPDPAPNAGAFAVTGAVQVSTETAGLDVAKVLLAFEVPLIVAFDVVSTFQTPDANGYVFFLPEQDVLGGHAAHLAGWVDNADLPAGAPVGAGGGYFVLKNSWGIGNGDCGYFYVPFDYLLKYASVLSTVEVN